VRRLTALLAVAVALGACGGGRRDFLDAYVDDSGRVVRHDQGGDTVSEGQAYALLLADAARDRRRFDRVWTWTRTHLRRRDGLLASRWAGGRVVDRDPASDADLDAARALMLAGRRFHAPGYAAAGRALGRAIGEHETALAGGKTVLVAGPWAQARGVVNPSYFSPRAFRAIGRLDLAGTSRRLIDRLTAGGLPPDWAVVQPWGVTPARAPAGGAAAGYSYDAARLPVRLAESCDPADRALAARLWPRLRDAPGAARRALDGRPLGDGRHAVALTGAAGAAYAAGDRKAAAYLLHQAAQLDAKHPTYYGSAWVALTRAMLFTHSLGACRS
jgi:endoglucanase